MMSRLRKRRAVLIIGICTVGLGTGVVLLVWKGPHIAILLKVYHNPELREPQATFLKFNCPSPPPSLSSFRLGGLSFRLPLSEVTAVEPFAGEYQAHGVEVKCRGLKSRYYLPVKTHPQTNLLRLRARYCPEELIADEITFSAAAEQASLKDWSFCMSRSDALVLHELLMFRTRLEMVPLSRTEPAEVVRLPTLKGILRHLSSDCINFEYFSHDESMNGSVLFGFRSAEDVHLIRCLVAELAIDPNVTPADRTKAAEEAACRIQAAIARKQGNQVEKEAD